MLLGLKRAVAKVVKPFPSIQMKIKRLNELAFWYKHKYVSGGFSHGHLKQFYTSFFGISDSYYRGLRVLDVGCGPLGSLEWASEAAERVGVDPLANSYVKMNGGRQSMRYVAAPSEEIPFDTGYFDVVAMFNALDHVEDVDRTASELVRVCRPGGVILIIVEINHLPSITEPHDLRKDVVLKFSGCEVVKSNIFGIRDDHDVYRSLMERTPHRSDESEGILCVQLRKNLNS